MTTSIARDEQQAVIRAAHRGDIQSLRETISNISRRLAIDKSTVLVSCRDAERNTTLHKAAELGLTDVLEFLLNDDNFLNAPGARTLFVNFKNNYNETPAYIATSNGHLNYLRALVYKRAELNSRNNIGFTPLHAAVTEHGLTTHNNGGASQGADRFTVIVRYLLYQGSDADAVTNNGDTAMHLATRNRDRVIMDILLNTTAKNDRRNSSGDTPLHVAVRSGCLDVVKSLLRHARRRNSNGVHLPDPYQLEGNHVDPNSMNSQGYSIIHTADRSGNVNVLEALLEHGVDEERRTRTGLSAQEVAQLYNIEEMEAFFINRSLNRQ